MKLSTNENRTIFMLLIVIAFVVVSAIYYYAVYPKIEEKNQTRQSIDAIELEIEQLHQTFMSTSGVKSKTDNEFELRKKLPGQREISALLMSLQEIELVSDAKINEILFNDYDALVSQSNLADEVHSEEEKASANEESEEVKEEVPVTNIDIAALPEHLKLLTLQLHVDVKDEAHLLQFIQEIEALERVIRVDDIRFTLRGEAELAVEEPDETIGVTLQLTTFYAETEAS